MSALSGMSKAWTKASAALPLGWELDSIRCASGGMSPEQRSDKWIAVALGPEGEEIQVEGEGPISALANLALSLRKARGSMDG